IEIAIVIILLLGAVVWTGYFLKQEKDLSETNIIASQLNDIANDVLSFDWPESSTLNVPYVYDLDDLIDKGVVSERNYLLRYSVLMYWVDKNTYDVLVYVKSPLAWDSKQLKEIANMVGSHGGFVDADGRIKMNAQSVIKNITLIETVKLKKNSPIVLYQMVKNSITTDEIPFIPKIVQMNAAYTEWGAKKRLNYLNYRSVTWNPAYVSDEFGIFWSTDSMMQAGSMTVRVSDVNTKEILQTQEVAGQRFFLIPSERLLGKSLLIEVLYKDSVLMSRELIVSKLINDDKLVVNSSVGIYSNSPDSRVTRETGTYLMGPYFFFCPYTFSVEPTVGSSGGVLIEPIIYNINFYFGGDDYLDIGNIYVKSIPYSFRLKEGTVENIIPFCSQFAKSAWGGSSNLLQVNIRSLNTDRQMVTELSSPVTIRWTDS
ncbi:TPA: hypothetical protein J1W79_004526, partial [Escherichia coli]|nr:hypothetical protein [Escherichia coli]